MNTEPKPLEQRIYDGALTRKRLCEVLSYEPETGVFRWLVAPSPFFQAGTEAGSNTHVSGYRSIKVDKKMYKAHRLAFLYMTGEWPPAFVDHINGIKSDNRWINLRNATRAENHRNVGPRANNKSGFKGVCWHKDCKAFVAQARFNGKQTYLGSFKTAEAAAMAYRQFAIANYGEFVNGCTGQEH